MANWLYAQSVEDAKRYEAIKCLTCHKLLGSKSELRNHKGHDVHYVRKDGTVDD